MRRFLHARGRGAQPARGSILMLCLVITAILVVLAAGAISATGFEQQAAVSKLTSEQLQACAVAGRRLLVSKLKVFNVKPDQIVFREKLPDGQSGEYSEVMTGHYCTGADCCDPATGANCVKPQIVSSSILAASRKQARDMANIAGVGATLGGQYYTVGIVCQSHGRQAELEFLFRYGM